MRTMECDVKSSDNNKKDPVTGNWTGPNGEDLGPKGETKRCVVGKATFNQYDTLEEAEKALGSKDLLDTINVQVKTDALNAVRAAATGKPSEAALRNEAWIRLATSPEYAGELQKVQGDNAAAERLVTSIINKIKQEKGLPTDD